MEIQNDLTSNAVTRQFKLHQPPDRIPSLISFLKDQNKYFELSSSKNETEQKHDKLVKTLMLFQDSFTVMAAQPIYKPKYGLNGNVIAEYSYKCSQCLPVGELPGSVPHYEHCQIIKILEMLKNGSV